MDPRVCRELFWSQPVARMATIGRDGPQLVPIVFAGSGDLVFTAVDHKPKRTRQLRRLANIDANPLVSLLVDRYTDDWERLWWVRADGDASIYTSGEVFTRAIGLLTGRYEQYRRYPPQGPVIAVTVRRWTGWAARPEDRHSMA